MHAIDVVKLVELFDMENWGCQNRHTEAEVSHFIIVTLVCIRKEVSVQKIKLLL